MKINIQFRIQKIMKEIDNMDDDLLYKWKNNIYTNKYLIDRKCHYCILCSKYLFLVEENIVNDNFLGIAFLENHIHFNNKFLINVAPHSC